MQIFNWLATNVEATAVCSQVYDWYGLKSDRHNYYDFTHPAFPNFDTDKSGSSISFIIHFFEVIFTPRACLTPQALRQLWAVNWVAPTALLLFCQTTNRLHNRGAWKCKQRVTEILVQHEYTISKKMATASDLAVLWGQLTYSTVGCRRTGGRRSQPGSFLFFTTSANLVLILQSVFESRRITCSAQTVCDDACWAGNAAETFQSVEVESFRSPSNAAEEVVFTANALCVWWTVLNSFFQPGSFLFLGEIPAWPFFGKPFFGTRQYCRRRESRPN